MTKMWKDFGHSAFDNGPARIGNVRPAFFVVVDIIKEVRAEYKSTAIDITPPFSL